METEHTPVPRERAAPGPRVVPIAIAAAALFFHALWGGNSVAAKFAFTGLPPIGLAGLRFALAALVVGAWGAVRREPLWPSRREVLPLAINGLLFTAQIATFYIGVFWSSASHAAVLINTFPIFVAVFAHFWLVGDHLNAGKVVGIALGFGGTAAVFSDRWDAGAPAMLVGDAVLLLSALILGAKNTYLKEVVARITPHKVVFSQMLFSLGPYFAYSLAFEGLLGAKPDAVALLALGYQSVVVGAFCFMGWTIILQRIPASKLAVFGFSSPVSGVILSHLLLGEPLTSKLVAGMALVALGIGIAARS